MTPSVLFVCVHNAGRSQMAAGLLSHVGLREGESRDYSGARNSKFVLAPGSVLTKRPPRWVVVAELVETSRLYGRIAARIGLFGATILGPMILTAILSLILIQRKTTMAKITIKTRITVKPLLLLQQRQEIPLLSLLSRLQCSLLLAQSLHSVRKKL